MRFDPRVWTMVAMLSCRREGTTEPPSPASVEATAPVVEAKPAPPSPQYWSGAISIMGMELGFHVALQRDGERWVGTIDIPAQSAKGMPLDAIEVTSARVVFGVAKVDAKWTITLDAEGQADECGFVQRGQTFECGAASVSAERFAELTAVKRPQTPQPPFDYEAVDVEIPNDAAGTRLAGTLTIPKGEERRPALLLVAGSGPQDRDGTILGHKPFWVIADHLARHGIAVLRVDDRGVGRSTGDFATATTADFIGDATASVRFLRAHPRIDPRRVGILGHSEGALVAPAVAVASEGVAFVALFGAPGLPGADILVQQGQDIARAAGVPADEVARAGALQREMIDAVLAGEDASAMRARLERQPGIDPASIDGQLAALASPWFKHFLAYDPRPVLRKLKVPTLVVIGELDLQVSAATNVPAITKALRAAKNRNVTVHRLAGLNHLLQHTKTGLPGEYETLEETLAPEVLTLLTDWVRAR